MTGSYDTTECESRFKLENILRTSRYRVVASRYGDGYEAKETPGIGGGGTYDADCVRQYDHRDSG